MIKRNWFNELQSAASQYPHLAWAIGRMAAEYSSAQNWKPVAASLSSGCAEQQGRIEELEKQLEHARTKVFSIEAQKVIGKQGDQIEKFEKQLEAVRRLLESAECPNRKCDGDGVIWLGGDGSNIEQCQWCYEKKVTLKESSDE